MKPLFSEATLPLPASEKLFVFLLLCPCACPW